MRNNYFPSCVAKMEFEAEAIRSRTRGGLIWLETASQVEIKSDWIRSSEEEELHARISSGPVVTLLAYGILVLPSLALACYIAVFGASGVFWDEWEVVPLIKKMMSGTLSFGDFFGQQNEHRIPFARALILAIARVTKFNTLAEQALS